MTPATAALPWRELTTLAGSGDGEQTLVARLLAHWRAECGAGTAALYLAAGDTWQKAKMGTDTFNRRMSALTKHWVA